MDTDSDPCATFRHHSKYTQLLKQDQRPAQEALRQKHVEQAVKRQGQQQRQQQQAK